jgi:hypothetical protein
MTTENHTNLVTRDIILNLLSDTDVARVTHAETASSLADGDQYIDLAHLAQGVQHADDTSTPMNHILPRNSVDKKTWNAIMKEVSGMKSSSKH